MGFPLVYRISGRENKFSSVQGMHDQIVSRDFPSKWSISLNGQQTQDFNKLAFENKGAFPKEKKNQKVNCDSRTDFWGSEVHMAEM